MGTYQITSLEHPLKTRFSIEEGVLSHDFSIFANRDKKHGLNSGQTSELD